MGSILEFRPAKALKYRQGRNIREVRRIQFNPKASVPTFEMSEINHWIVCMTEDNVRISLLTNIVSNHRAVNREDTFIKIATKWLESHKQTWAEWTYRKFKADLTTRVFPKIGSRNVKELSGKDLRLLREAILAEGRIDGAGEKLSNRSVNRIMQPVKAVFNELFADGELLQNPAMRLGKLKEKCIAEIDPFSDAEIKLLLKKIVP